MTESWKPHPLPTKSTMKQFFVRSSVDLKYDTIATIIACQAFVHDGRILFQEATEDAATRTCQTCIAIPTS
eukprot:6922578-Lingulodinium_polyedra.AAC.1